MRDGNNLHRCVILKDSADVVTGWLPYSAQSSSDPEDLWAALLDYEQTTGGEALSIPHNGNLSNGLMWDTVTYDGDAISSDYAERRMRWEPIAEVTQLKGDSETHPSLSPDDPFADFERWDEYNISKSTTERILLISSSIGNITRREQTNYTLIKVPDQYNLSGRIIELTQCLDLPCLCPFLRDNIQDLVYKRIGRKIGDWLWCCLWFSCFRSRLCLTRRCLLRRLSRSHDSFQS